MKPETAVKKMLSSIELGSWRFILKAQNDGRLPGFKGSTIRGAFGMALRRMSCIAGINNDCRRCMVFENCMYALTFESVNNKEKNKGKFLGVYEYIPHPFAFSDKSGGKRDYKKGESLEFEMLLVEPYIGRLPYYIYALKNAAETGLGKDNALKFVLEAVRGKDGADVYTRTSDKLDESYVQSRVSAENIMAGRAAGNVEIDFLTPVRIKHNEKLAEKIDFKILATALLRRASGIAAHYAGADTRVDANEYLADAGKVKTKKDSLAWHDWERFSKRQKGKMKMGGLKGSIVFEGKELKKYIPLLRLGEVLKIGKGTSMGLGEYRVRKTGGLND